ncbi:vacuolar H+-ATPase catalytic subunit [Artemisia annua]|uniref:Vacuolar H+-ATPase catalytic subunit n=1 Tax=Artemisia annua TaxID=35608 RepID=A0A2U1PZ74_ARTAN|nr:vacuolar H+-ATPase catalytic subunit [Artemisia annua]
MSHVGFEPGFLGFGNIQVDIFFVFGYDIRGLVVAQQIAHTESIPYSNGKPGKKIKCILQDLKNHLRSPYVAGQYICSTGYLLQFLLYGQRPLKTIARISGDVYIPRGVSAPTLDNDILWEFQHKKVGSLTHCNLPLLKPKRSQVMDGVLSQAQEMLCNAWRGTCVRKLGAADLTQLSSIVDIFSSNDLPRVAETLANMRHCLTAFVEGSVFEDVKCKDVVELERIRLELEEIVKLFTNGEIYLKRQAMTAYVVTLPLTRSWDMAFRMSPYSKVVLLMLCSKTSCTVCNLRI